MQLSKLIEYQSSGALKISYDKTTGTIKLGGTPITSDVCAEIAHSLGWERFDAKPWEIIDKTDKFIKSLRKNLCDEAMAGADISFRNFRRMNTESYYDRIKLISPNLDVTILYHMPGLGGTYAVFTPHDGFRQPQFACRTMKQMCDYLNEFFE